MFLPSLSNRLISSRNGVSIGFAKPLQLTKNLFCLSFVGTIIIIRQLLSLPNLSLLAIDIIALLLPVPIGQSTPRTLVLFRFSVVLLILSSVLLSIISTPFLFYFSLYSLIVS